jgi:NAD(P)-dependent dehydrogenase (short-subunit alcohol dehydrogenase family)
MFFASESDNESGSGKSGKTNIIAGASGYIGKSTVRESVRQGYNTIALVRDASKVNSPEGKALYGQFFEGATVVECDVCDPAALTKVCTSISTSIFLFHLRYIMIYGMM